MSTELLIELISLCGTICSVLITSKVTQNKVMQELKTQNEVQNCKLTQLSDEISSLKDDIKSCNMNAKLSSEAISVLQEKISVANHRLTDCEEEIKLLRNKL